MHQPVEMPPAKVRMPAWIILCLLVWACTISNGLASEATDLLDQAEKSVINDEIDESVKYYLEATKLDDSLAIHERMARIYFEKAESIRTEHRPEFLVSLKAWMIAREGAFEDRRGFHVRDDGTRNYKKFNPQNKEYVAATTAHKKILKKISACYPYYTKAQEIYTKILLKAPNGKHFNAAAHLALCLIVVPEVYTWSRGRQMLVAFLGDYKPTTDAERELFQKCKEVLKLADKPERVEIDVAGK